jgi:hypothetical protein
MMPRSASIDADRMNRRADHTKAGRDVGSPAGHDR